MKYQIANHYCEYQENPAAFTFGMEFNDGKLFIAGSNCASDNCTLSVFINGHFAAEKKNVRGVLDLIGAIVTCYYAGLYDDSTDNIFVSALTLMKINNMKN